MRKILFTLLATGALLAAAPAASLAVSGGDHHRGDRHQEPEHRRHHHRGHHHDGTQRERFHGGEHGGIHQNAGTVSSFAGDRLTIMLADGTTVSGTVNRFTEVECEMPGAFRTSDQGSGDSGGNGGPGGGDNGPGDDHGHDGNGNGNPNGNNDPGDDNGQDGPGHHGDDHGAQCSTIAPGTIVRDATLSIGGSGAVWTRVDLIDS